MNRMSTSWHHQNTVDSHDVLIDIIVENDMPNRIWNLLRPEISGGESLLWWMNRLTYHKEMTIYQLIDDTCCSVA